MDRGVPTEEVLAEMRAADPPVHYLVGHAKGSLDAFGKNIWSLSRGKRRDPGVQSLPRRRPGSSCWRKRASSRSWPRAPTVLPRACPGEGRGAGDTAAPV